MSKNLYIIGNGFDLWQGLLTSYQCFNCFMCRIHPDDHRRIGHIYNQLDPSMLWSDYEKALGKLNVIGLVERNIENWANMESHQLGNAFDSLAVDLKLYFQEWVTNINYDTANNKRLCGICNDKDALFLTFNYTNTLERFYGIPQKQICYIHGDTSNNEFLQPIVGHGVAEDEIKEIVKKNRKKILRLVSQHPFPKDEINYDDWTDLIVKEIIQFLKDLRKKTEELVNTISDWLQNVTQIDEIYILGHSLSPIDALYFKNIYEKYPKAKWYVSYREEMEKSERKKKLRKLLEVKSKDITIETVQLDDLCCKE